MTNPNDERLTDDEKARRKKAVIAGLLLTAAVFAWFIIYFITNIPDQH